MKKLKKNLKSTHLGDKKTIFLRGLLLSYNIVGNKKQVGTISCANKVKRTCGSIAKRKI